MKWIVIGGGSLVALLTTIFLIAWTKPSTVAVSRSVVIHAPAPIVFELIEDFHNWPLWAPQDREDARMKRSFSGPARGVGAISSWVSNGSAGKGQMTISRSISNSQVDVLVDFRAPFVAHNVNTFSIEPVKNDTRLTWSMHGTNPFVLKLMSVFVAPDAILGSHFENCLNALKSNAEHQFKAIHRQ